ncbi:MAG: hypothetical protein U0324_36820 [Polyangiales bacterium]
MSRRKHPHASPASIVTPSTGSIPPPPPGARPAPDAPKADAPQPDAPDASCGDAPDASVHEVESLAQGYGATDAEVAAVVGNIPADAIDEASRHCGTVRVCDEASFVACAARNYFARAPGAPSLRLGEGVVRVMVTCAAHAAAARRADEEAKVEQKSDAPADTPTQTRDLTKARGASRQLANVLRGVCAGDAGALARIRAAEQPGRVGHHDAGPGRALLSLVELGREVLDDPSRADTAAAWGLTADWLASLAPVADAARRATAARLAPAAPAVDTAVQRRWRGLTVILLQRVVGAFAAGHALDADVSVVRPRFLRGLLTPKRKAKKADAKTAEAKPAKAPAEAKAPAATKPAAPADAKPAPTA